MSMHNYSCTGYLVKASDLTKLLPARQQEAYKTAVENGDWETANEILGEHFPEQLPSVETVFTMADEAEFDDAGLQKGEMYVQFAEEDLYKKVPTLAHSNLMVEGITPVRHSWVDFA
jgi:hypothetical protein